MEPKDAVPRVDAPRAATRTRAVVALARPCTPNAAVIRAGADLAARHRVPLLVLGVLEPLLTDWVDGVDVSGPMLEAAHGELFAACVETLWERDLVWGVDVAWGRVSAAALNLAGRVDVVRMVCGQRRADTLLRRLRRRITGRLRTALADVDLVVV